MFVQELEGSFEVKSGKLILSDPCYERGTWCQGTVEAVRNGSWKAFTRTLAPSETQGWGHRVAELEAYSVEHGSDDGTWEKSDIQVGVDSGQAGIFDESGYPRGERGEYGDETTFYGRACKATCDDEADAEWRKAEREYHNGTMKLLDEALCRGEAIVRGEKYDDDSLTDRITELKEAHDRKVKELAERPAKMAGIIEEGVVSSSGFGDGGYDAYVKRDSDGKAVAVKIVFISDDDDDDDDEVGDGWEEETDD